MKLVEENNDFAGRNSPWQLRIIGNHPQNFVDLILNINIVGFPFVDKGLWVFVERSVHEGSIVAQFKDIESYGGGSRRIPPLGDSASPPNLHVWIL